MRYVLQRKTGQWKDHYVCDLTSIDVIDSRLCKAKQFNSIQQAQSFIKQFLGGTTQTYMITPITEKELFKARLFNT